MTELHELTISEASTLLHTREVSAVDLVEATLSRIEATEPAVHAYAHVMDDMARRAAYQADRDLAQNHVRGPLHGIPVGVKDICYTAGVVTESGSRAKAGFIPDYDATVVERIRDAGGIIVGKTATHEFAYGVNTPATTNPWSPGCYPGGSSTGSGVAVSVRSAFGGIGTCTGGSIRIPAAIEGIVGLKPTFGRVSRRGVVPLSNSLDHVGPMTRTVEDCAIMLQAIAGYDPLDSGSIDHPVDDYRANLEAGVDGLVIGIEWDYFFYDGVADDVRAAVEAVIRELEQQGATIVGVKLPELELMTQVGVTIMLAEASTFNRYLFRERPTDFEQATRYQVELGEFIPGTHYLTAQRARVLMKNAMARLFRAHNLDMMLWPTMPITTVPIPELTQTRPDYPAETPILSCVHHSFNVNVTGQPALSVPCGFSSDGLPIGFQLAGRPFEEAKMFQVARAYEREHTWFEEQPPV